VTRLRACHCPKTWSTVFCTIFFPLVALPSQILTEILIYKYIVNIYETCPIKKSNMKRKTVFVPQDIHISYMSIYFHDFIFSNEAMWSNHISSLMALFDYTL
jgi:ABC-type sugar transport system permease subunit